MTSTQIRIPWPNWEIVHPLGGGSFGKVYEIRRKLLGGGIEKAAMKVISVPTEPLEAQELLNSGYDRESINQRFLQDLEDIAREYTLMAGLKGNVNVVYCDDLSYQPQPDGLGWELYIKMELLSPLTHVLNNPPKDDQVIKLGMDICNALSACKKKTIIHRDIKPANIMVSEDGHYKLGDFGIAKTAERTAGGTKTGTYSYMAPEVYNNQPYGAAVDIYSLGMVLYWILNGRCGPFLPSPPTVPSATQVDDAKLRRFRGEPLPAPIYGSEALQQVVLKACAFAPKDRFAAPEEMADALANVLSSGQSTYSSTEEFPPQVEESTVISASESNPRRKVQKKKASSSKPRRKVQKKKASSSKRMLPEAWLAGSTLKEILRNTVALFADLFGIMGLPFFLLFPMITILSDAFGPIFSLVPVIAYFPATYLVWQTLKRKKNRFLVMLIRAVGYFFFFAALLIAFLTLGSLLTVLGTIGGNL